MSRLCPTPRPSPTIEAHRGDSANAPENTLAAFRRAVALGAKWIELDVHPTRDQALVVIHDETVDRTTNGTGAVRDLTAAEVRALDAGSKFGRAFAGERVPLLTEVFELVAATDTRLNLEVKASPAGVDVPATLIGLLRRFGKEREFVVSSFHLDALLAVRGLAPELTLALIGDGPQILPLAVAHRLPWVHVAYRTATPELVAAAHTNGIRVNVWTMDEPTLYDHWARLGVDKICTNRPGCLLAASRRTAART